MVLCQFNKMQQIILKMMQNKEKIVVYMNFSGNEANSRGIEPVKRL